MKNIKIKLILICFVCFVSCVLKDESKNENSIIVIDIANTINKKGNKISYLNDISQDIRLIPIETNDSILFKHVNIEGITEEYIVAHDGNIGVNKIAVYLINKNSGKVASIIDRRGQGPGDYLRIANVFVNTKDNTIFLSDNVKINEYTFDGKFIKSIKNDSIDALRILSDDNFAVSFSPLVNQDYALGIYDKSWVLKRKSIPKLKIKEKFDMVYFDAIFNFNNDFFYKLAHSDTLYRFTSEFDEPYLVHSKGRYTIPFDIKANREMTEKYGNRYVQYDFGYLISKYYFLTYYYNNKFYSEIWNIEESSLLFKSIYGRDGRHPGIPVIIGEEIINVWPSYVKNNYLYCIIENEDALKIMPSLPEDTNPIILEVKLK